jgi:hypothetical protein
MEICVFVRQNRFSQAIIFPASTPSRAAIQVIFEFGVDTPLTRPRPPEIALLMKRSALDCPSQLSIQSDCIVRFCYFSFPSLHVLVSVFKSVQDSLMFGSWFYERCLIPGLTCSPQA